MTTIAGETGHARTLRSRVATRVAAALAVVAWATIALQLYLTVTASVANGNAPLVGVLRNFSFFTVLTNTLAALVLSAPILPEPLKRWLSSAGTRAAAAAYITMVGIIYTLVLRDVWDPQGLQKLADIVLHDAMPILYVAFWLIFWRTGTTPWSAAPSWLIYPLGYLGYCLVHGAITGWYPYHFLDAGALGYSETLVNAAMITAAFSVLCLIVIAIDRSVSSRRVGPA